MLKQIADQLNGSFAAFHAYADIRCRSSWQALDEVWKERTIQLGEQYLDFTFPGIPATSYMEFFRTGNRSHYEDILFSKRHALNALTLAECVEHRGRFLDAILNGIFSLCEESAWYLPAHNSYIRDTKQLPLPDASAPVLDLFACETASVLAVVYDLLKPVLDEISPLIAKRIRYELQERIFTPYLTRNFWWMGNGQEPMNNWTVWCTQNVLLAAFLTDQEPDFLMNTVRKACTSIDYFLEEYGEDGCCDEGAQYYKVSGLCLFHSLELLNTVTADAFLSLYSTPKIKNIASYLYHVHIHDKYYVNFADCAPIAGRCSAREYLFAKKTGNQDMMTFSAADFQAGIAESDSHLLLSAENNLYFRLLNGITVKELRQVPISSVPLPPDLYYESVGIFAARDERFYLAVKAGCNADSHNHNDTGSFTVYKEGLPMLIDVGVETYTQKTFSPRRYEIWTMQSAYHNLPTIRGIQQKDGAEYAASDVECRLDQNAPYISMNIAGAYPAAAGISSYYRHVQLKKGSGIIIQDSFSIDPGEIVLSLMTYEKPSLQHAAPLSFAIGSLGTLLVEGGTLEGVEEIPITDKRLQNTWQHEVYRILIRAAAQTMQITIS